MVLQWLFVVFLFWSWNFGIESLTAPKCLNLNKCSPFTDHNSTEFGWAAEGLKGSRSHTTSTTFRTLMTWNLPVNRFYSYAKKNNENMDKMKLCKWARNFGMVWFYFILLFYCVNKFGSIIFCSFGLIAVCNATATFWTHECRWRNETEIVSRNRVNANPMWPNFNSFLGCLPFLLYICCVRPLTFDIWAISRCESSRTRKKMCLHRVYGAKMIL